MSFIFRKTFATKHKNFVHFCKVFCRDKQTKMIRKFEHFFRNPSLFSWFSILCLFSHSSSQVFSPLSLKKTFDKNYLLLSFFSLSNPPLSQPTLNVLSYFVLHPFLFHASLTFSVFFLYRSQNFKINNSEVICFKVTLLLCINTKSYIEIN